MAKHTIFIKKIHQKKGIKYNFLEFKLQFIKAYHFLKINEEDLTETFIDEIYSSQPKKNYPTNKIVYNHIDENWSIHLADMIDYKISNNKGYRYIFVIIDKFSKHLWAIPLKNKYSKTITNEFSNILTTSNRQPLKMEPDRGSEFYNSIFQNSLKAKNIQHYSRYTVKASSIAERVIRNVRNLLKKPVFETGNADWISELPSAVKKYKNTFHHSIKMTPILASKKSNERKVYTSLQDRRVKQKPKFKLGELLCTADIKRVFSKGDSTNWSYQVYTVTQVIHDTIPSYRIDYLPERYNESLLLPTKLSLEENNQVKKELNLLQ